VPEIARFSDPPKLDDLRTLQLDHDDVEAIRKCQPESCDLKLTTAEMTSLHASIKSAGTEWRSALQDTFRQIVLDRIMRYLADGHPALAPYADRQEPTSLQQAFSAVIQHSSFLDQHAPNLAAYLDWYPHATLQGVESFTYWSVEQLGGRPSVTATHVAIVTSDAPDQPESLVAGKQIFATHYVSASLNITAIVRGRSSSDHYLVYVNRSRVDVLDRWYGGLARLVIERRVKGEAADVFRGLKIRIESGDPPR
jgi:hypothetical protein